jgi:hypothetical protein
MRDNPECGLRNFPEWFLFQKTVITSPNESITAFRQTVHNENNGSRPNLEQAAVSYLKSLKISFIASSIVAFRLLRISAIMVASRMPFFFFFFLLGSLISL